VQKFGQLSFFFRGNHHTTLLMDTPESKSAEATGRGDLRQTNWQTEQVTRMQHDG